MSKKLTWFYRIGTWTAVLFIALNISTKTLIWSSASLIESPKESTEGNIHFINIFPSTSWVRHKYTTELKQRMFNQADYLLTPAFLLIFIMLTIKLINVQRLFEETGAKK